MTARARWRRAGRRLIHVLRLVGWGAPGRGSLRERAAIATDERYRRFNKFMGRADDLEAGRCGRQEFAEEMARVEGDAHEAVARARNRERWHRRDADVLSRVRDGLFAELAASRVECVNAKNATSVAVHTARQELHRHYAAVEQQNLRLQTELAAAEAQRIAANLEHEREPATSRRACAWPRPKTPGSSRRSTRWRGPASSRRRTALRRPRRGGSPQRRRARGNPNSRRRRRSAAASGGRMRSARSVSGNTFR